MKHTLDVIVGPSANPAMLLAYYAVVRDTAEDGTVSYYRISSIPSAFDTGRPETLAFVSDEDGNVQSWTDVVGIAEQDIDKCIAELKAVLEGRAEYDTFDSPAMQAADGDPLQFMLNTMSGLARKIEEDISRE